MPFCHNADKRHCHIAMVHDLWFRSLVLVDTNMDISDRSFVEMSDLPRLPLCAN